MVRATSIVVGLLFALNACATTGSPPTKPTVYVLRHLNTPAGVTDPNLTNDGRDAANALVVWFQTRKKPSVIYVSSTKRAQQTVGPLARSLKLSPKIYDPADTPALVANVMREPQTVLVVGHSNTVPEIIERLGGTKPAPLVHEDFGDIWQINGWPRETRRFRIVKLALQNGRPTQ